MIDIKTTRSFYKFCIVATLIFSACATAMHDPLKSATEVVHNRNIDIDDHHITIAFGSCSREDRDLSYFDHIVKLQPDAWIWLGDIIYGDTEDMTIMQDKYNRVKTNPHYINLIEKTPTFGIWDDHDYGANNAGKEYRPKAESRDLLFEFLDVQKPLNAGAYQSYSYSLSNHKIRIILLDSRYFRDQPMIENGSYVADSTIDILGERQWQWLEREMESTLEDEVVLIANGIQVIPEEHAFEKWANFPRSRKKLLELLDNASSKHIFLLSGDRHTSEISQLDLENKTLLEITSSGLTHSYDKLTYESNKHRVGPHISSKSFATMRYDFSNAAFDIAFYDATTGKKLFHYNSVKNEK